MAKNENIVSRIKNARSKQEFGKTRIAGEVVL